jgi:hypothetical protein
MALLSATGPVTKRVLRRKISPPTISLAISTTPTARAQSLHLEIDLDAFESIPMYCSCAAQTLNILWMRSQVRTGLTALKWKVSG